MLRYLSMLRLRSLQLVAAATDTVPCIEVLRGLAERCAAQGRDRRRQVHSRQIAVQAVVIRQIAAQRSAIATA